MSHTRQGGSRPSVAVTTALWLTAALLVALGMALDARGELTLSILLFLLASAALVAPLVLRRLPGRRTDGSESSPQD